MNFRRKMRRRKKPNIEKPTGRLTRRAMMYGCEDCKRTWRMWLELGLEEPGDNHKPVPFAIPCKYCDGTAFHIAWNRDLTKDDPIPILESDDYFANISGTNHGIPKYSNGKL